MIRNNWRRHPKNSPSGASNFRIGEINKGVLPAMRQQLNLKGYSESTIKTYISEVSCFLKQLADVSAEAITPARLRNYFEYCYIKLRLSEHTLHSRINALKFYYEQVLGREKFFWDIPRPKKPELLPKVLSEIELERMFKSVGNLKHKAILFTAYSAGLRVSEVVGLRLNDIDSNRMQIFISRAKGKKDRGVGLSRVLLDVLREYILQASPRPKEYLFEGEIPGKAYSIRSAQVIFQKAKDMAGIRKEVSFHSLRHSFATHMMEKGIDTKYIKDILGHFNIKTTERYLHVRKEDLICLTSPLDDLYRGRDWQAR